MSRHERQFIESEINELKRILGNIPQDKIIKRKGYEHRLAQAEATLRLMQTELAPETMTITFKGKPVRGTHGIYADFATKVMNTLSDAYAALVATAKGITLGSRGDIPEFDKHRLLITGTALGSFGFELELPTPEPMDTPVQGSLLPKENPIIQARDMLERVLTQSLEGDDDQLAESLEDIDQRALSKIQAFYEVLQQDEAVFSLAIGSRQITCSSVEKAQQAGARLKSDNIATTEACFAGQLTGVLPQRRDFEFIDTEKGLIRGKIDKSIDDANVLNREWLGKPASIRLASRTVGQGRPRYTLMSLEHITPTDTEASHG